MITTETFTNKQIEIVRKQYAEQGEIQPMWIAETNDGEILVLATPEYGDPATKPAIEQVIRNLFKENEVWRYCFVFEAWFHTADSKEKIDAAIDRYGSVSQMPERQEAINVIVEESGKMPIGHTIVITRDENGKGHLSEKIQTSNFIHFFRGGFLPNDGLTRN